ncbi:MAG: MBOAT family protein [Desulfobacteraceae bacterium]|nr:MAG: MBOAT family protein [Desulfobacteraceae bacterium]
MLFNSYIYIFLFLPASVGGYFLLNHYRRQTLADVFLVFANLFFYAWWDWRYLPLLVLSVAFNFYIGKRVDPQFGRPRQHKTALIFGLAVNLGALAFFKYADFFIENLNLVAGLQVKPLGLGFPLAISFFTFVQIAYLVDRFRGGIEKESFIKYALFATFFPQLLSGPIVRHGQMKAQYAGQKQRHLNWENVYAGLVLFSMGLFKKVFIADTFAVWATAGFDHAGSLNLVEAWITSISYTLQIYYDFSGYTDMAIGSARFFNIHLPQNFNSPYKALNIQDFWRRWHMTLSGWLRDYLFIPLGGSRGGSFNTYRNLMITFVLCGLWHGAGWTFIFWGLMHGAAIVIHRRWSASGYKMPVFPAWVLTFLFLNISWVFFRAPDFQTAISVLSGMINIGSLYSAADLKSMFSAANLIPGEYTAKIMAWLACFSGLAFLAGNSNQLTENIQPSIRWAFITLILLLMGMPDFQQPSEFLYFNF